uniref:Protein kinase domain-containing protein n=1 Tax=Heterorhabditis bacteriophora TaxID=37862 RepID=A0A1I7XR84_HETBA
MRAPTSQMVINMKTTITTHGGHNGVIVQSGLQAGMGDLMRYTSGSNPFVRPVAPTQSSYIENPGGIVGTSTHPVQVVDGSSLENTIASCTNLPSPGLKLNFPISQVTSSPSSPTFSFTGKDSPPEEFILPSNVNLNVFNQQDPVLYEAVQRREQKSADAVINDTMTTTTTVEVFRTPVTHNNQFVALPRIPTSGIDDRPYLLRVNGPSYEKWSTSRVETLINDPPIASNNQPGKAVQWKEELVDNNSQIGTDRNSRLLNETPSMVRHGVLPYTVQSPSKFAQVTHHTITNSKENIRSSYQPTSLENSIDPSLSNHIGYLSTSNASNLDSPALITKKNYSSYSSKDLNQDCKTSNLENRYQHNASKSFYMVPNRNVGEMSYIYSEDCDREFHKYGKPSYGSQNYSKKYQWSAGYNTLEDRSDDHQWNSGNNKFSDNYLNSEKTRPQISKSSFRRQYNEVGHKCQRSKSPDNKSQATNTGFACVGSNIIQKDTPVMEKHEIFNLYQTRDALQNVIAQLDVMDYGFDGKLQISPFEESSDSLISELSTKADHALSEVFELFPISYDSVRTIMCQFAHTDSSTLGHTNNALPSENDLPLGGFKDHIYELDNFQLKSVDKPQDCEDIKITYSTMEQLPMTEVTSNKLSEDMREGTITKSIAKENGVSVEEHEKDYPEVASTIFSDHRNMLVSENGPSFVQKLTPLDHAIIETKPKITHPRNQVSVKKAHPDGLVFPKIINSVPILPEVPEEKELSSQLRDETGIQLLVEPTYEDYMSSLDFKELDHEPRVIQHFERTNQDGFYGSTVNVLADKHKLLIQGWESLISSCADTDKEV